MKKITNNLAIILIFFSNNIFAEENIISGKIRTEIYAVDNYDSNNRQEEYKEYYSKAKLNLRAKLSDNLSLKSVIKTSEMDQNIEEEKRDKANPDARTRSFENEGAYLEKLYLKYQNQNFDFAIGKNTLNFGRAWKRDNYIWILNKASKYYRFNEKFAIESAIKGGSETKNGRYIITLGTYFNDDKYFDNSIITKRDYIDNYTIDVGNDKSLFSSFYTALDVDYDFGNDEFLKYHFAYVKSAVNERQSDIKRSKISDQKSYVANINYQIPISQNIIPKIFLEYAFLDNYKGNNIKDTSILTKYLMFNLYQDYYLTYTRSKVKYIEIANHGIDEIIDEISLGYKFNENSILNGLSTYIGYSKDKIDEKTSNQNIESAIIYLKYEKAF
jgi:hypothetical protein